MMGQLTGKKRKWGAMLILLALPLIFIGLFIEIFPQIAPIIGVWNVLFLLFVPGHCLLRLTKLNIKGSVPNIILVVCLSILFIFIVMATISLVSIIVGALPIGVSIHRIVLFLGNLILILIATRWGRRIDWGNKIRLKEIRPIIPIMVLPSLAVVSTYFLNVFNIISLQIVAVILLASIMPLIAFYGKNRPELCAAGIFSLAFSLLLLHSLISPFIVEWADLSFEFWAAERVLTNGYWDPTLFNGVNGMLSVSVLPAALSMVSNMGLITIFKVILPALFCLVPIGMFFIFKNVLGERPAFIGIALLLCLPSFYTEMLGLGRQQIAELFLIGLLLVILYGEKSRFLMVVLLSLGIVTSHYTISLLSIPILASCFLLLFAYKKVFRVEVNSHLANGYLLSAFIIAFLSFVYYNLVSGGYIATLVYSIGKSNLPGTNGPLMLWEPTLSLISPWLIIYILIVPALVVIGIRGLIEILQLRRDKAIPHYPIMVCGFSLALTVMLGFGNDRVISSSRLLHLAILLCGPAIIVGTTSIVNRLSQRRIRRKVLYTGAGVLISFLLLANTGLIGLAVGGDRSFMFDPDPEDRPLFLGNEVDLALWSQAHFDEDLTIHGDANIAYLVGMYTGCYNPFTWSIEQGSRMIPTGDWVVFGNMNIEGKMIIENPSNPRVDKRIVGVDIGTFIDEIEGTTIFDAGRAKVVLIQ